MVAPVGSIKKIQANCTASGRRMHEATFTDINTDMGHAAAGAEKHQIAGGKPLRRDAWALDRGQLARGAWQCQHVLDT